MSFCKKSIDLINLIKSMPTLVYVVHFYAMFFLPSVNVHFDAVIFLSSVYVSHFDAMFPFFPITAPEVFEAAAEGSGTGYSYPVDWWSLGITAYEVRDAVCTVVKNALFVRVIILWACSAVHNEPTQNSSPLYDINM